MILSEGGEIDLIIDYTIKNCYCEFATEEPPLSLSLSLSARSIRLYQ